MDRKLSSKTPSVMARHRLSHHRSAGDRSATALIVNEGSPLLIGNGSSCCSSSDERIHNELLRHALTHHPLHHHHHSNQHHSEVQQRYLIGCCLRKQRVKPPSTSCIGQGYVLSSPASLNGSLKRSEPNDSYSGTPTDYHHHHHHRNRQQLVASSDERTMQIANGAGTPRPYHPHNLGMEYGGPAPPSLPGTGTTVTPY
ncbi:homeobox protein B-H1-like [Anopheles darlingi]|uniref:homeobox protein B-H1-like n=1 Tax=Anopheles darlingi TaxID=43151 RepID=UPI00210022BB|nr:homeobox protein B-H1-like [Anopheles darlingi]